MFKIWLIKYVLHFLFSLIDHEPFCTAFSAVDEVFEVLHDVLGVPAQVQLPRVAEVVGGKIQKVVNLVQNFLKNWIKIKLIILHNLFEVVLIDF